MSVEILETGMTKSDDEVKYPITREQIEAMRAEFHGLTCSTKEGYQETAKAIRRLTSARTEIESVRVRLKADSLSYGRRVDSAAKFLSSIIEEVEKPLRAQKSEVDDAEYKARFAAQKLIEEAEQAETARRRQAEQERMQQERSELLAERLRIDAERSRIDVERARIEADRIAFVAEQVLEAKRRAQAQAEADRSKSEAEEEKQFEAERPDLEQVYRKLSAALDKLNEFHWGLGDGLAADITLRAVDFISRLMAELTEKGVHVDQQKR